LKDQAWQPSAIRIAIFTAAIHGAMLVVLISPQFFKVSVATSERIFHASIGAGAVLDDVDIYFKYASWCLNGQIPYRDFTVEYPILAFPLFLLPRLVANGRFTYYAAFAAEMLVLDAAIVWLLIRRVERTEGRERVFSRLVWYSVFLVGQGPTPLARFDLAPTLMAFWGALAWFGGRPASGGIVLGLGTLMKIFPGVVAAPALVFAGPGVSRAKGLISLALTVILGAGVWFALGGSRFAESLGYHLDRGLELSSMPSNALILWGLATGEPLSVVFAHGNAELVCSMSARVASLAPSVLAGAMLLVMIMRWLKEGEGLRFAAAAILAFMVGNKVLSPQYVIWLLPFIAAIGGKTGQIARPLFLVTCVVNFLVFPWAYSGIGQFHPLAIGIMTTRNVLLVTLLWVLLFTRERETLKTTPESLDDGMVN
jgi:hypothetical protein